MSFEGGPWGIVIVISAFMLQVFTFGVTGAIGVYNIEFLDYFQASASEVSLVAALNYGVFLACGPIVSYMMTIFSERKIVLGGSVLVVTGLLSVPIFPNLYVMYFTVGIVVGFGNCCTYIPSHTLSGLYYDKNRSLATGIATSGSGLGYAIMPVLAGQFIDMYSWKGSFILLAGLSLHLFIFGGLLRSPPKKSVIVDRKDLLVPLQSGEEAKYDPGNSARKMHDGHMDMYNKFKSDAYGSMIAMDGNKSHEQSLLDTTEESVSYFQDEILENNQSVPIKKEEALLPETARHVYIFKNYAFDIYFISTYLWNAGVAMFATFVPEYFRLHGFSILEVSRIIGAFGAGTLFGGILSGALGNIKGVNRIYMFIVSCLLVGLFILLIPLNQSFVYFSIMISLCGLSFGGILGLLVVVLADLVGIESLGNGMGYIMLSSGIGTFTGPVLSGMIIDLTGSYESSIYLSGIVSILSGVSMCLVPFRLRFECSGEKNVIQGVTHRKEIIS